MTSQEEQYDLADEVYSVDPLKQNPPYTKGTEFTIGPDEQEYIVYDSHHDPVSGFHGMAVVPAVAGKPDISFRLNSLTGAVEVRSDAAHSRHDPTPPLVFEGDEQSLDGCCRAGGRRRGAREHDRMR
ncbi:hypothetical protein [Leifsonia sp. 1010]|uniref:hypothetical protein n=1 Tax=Leifsonia sp. 1010 TaxID=2817769 RepID=UPI002857EB5D|nr:hypothetical protein [Leifsonia sp. 1010]MDR6612753.1 hypothetical protein [Leifsonia sp. 1010]